MAKQVIIVGAGGHAKVVADIVAAAGDKLCGFLEDNSAKKQFMGFPILGGVDAYEQFSGAQFIVAIGNAAIRERIVGVMSKAKWYTAIHPRAVISSLNTNIGEGTVVMPNAVINPCAVIGRHCIINTGAIVEHDNSIGDFVHISVGAKLAGAVSVGHRTWIGIGASVSNGITVCGDCMVGAGCVLVRDISEPGTYVGVPGKMIRPMA